MKKKLIAFLITGIMTASLVTGCGGGANTQAPAGDTEATEDAQATDEAGDVEEDAEAETEEEEAPDYQTYTSDKGWEVEYDANVIECNDETDVADEVNFNYTGDSAGTNLLSINFAEGKLPPEQIQAIKDVQEEGTKVNVEGGIMPGTTDKWAYWIDFEYPEEGNGATESYILTEFNGGTLCFESMGHKSGDDEIDVPISDAFSAIIDSIKFEDFGDQTMYDGIAGTYTAEGTEEVEGKETKVEFSLTLNEDHTGTLTAQDDVDILWDDKMIEGADGSFHYDYTLSNGKMSLNYDGQTIELTAK